MKISIYKLIIPLMLLTSFTTGPPPTLYSINGLFESYTSIPTCSNLSITKANAWSGLKVSYGNSCQNPIYSFANGGGADDPKYFNNASGGTTSCPPAATAGPFAGTGYAYLQFNGFAPNGTAKSNFVIQSPSSSIPGNTVVSLEVKINPLGTFSMAQNQIMVYLVPSNQLNVLDYIRTQSLAGLIPIPNQTQSGSWITSSYSFTTPNTATRYNIVVGPCNLWCNDASVSTIFKAVIDNVSVTY